MATAELMSMLPLHQIDQDSEMDNLFDFNRLTPQPAAAAAAPRPDTAIPFDDFDNHNFAGPSHQYDLFRQQTGIPVGDLSHLQVPDQLLLDPWNFDMDNMGGAGLSHMAPIAETPTGMVEEEEEESSNVGRLWPGMHQQQAQRAAQAKAQAQAQALALRQARASIQDMQLAAGRRPLMPQSQSQLQPRQTSIAPSVDDDSQVTNGFTPRPATSKREEEDMDDDERLLASEEGKKLTSKERRQLRNKVSARAFRSRRKEYITQLEGEINAKVQECNRLKSEGTKLAAENARYRDLIAFLIKQPSFAPVLAELNRNPAMSGAQGLSLLPPTGAQYPGHETSPTDPNMLNLFNDMPFNFR